MLDWVGGGRYRISTDPPRVVPVGRLKLYVPACVDGHVQSAPCGWFPPPLNEPPHDDSWIVEKILGTRKVKIPGQPKKKLQWHVQWKLGDRSWESREAFLTGVNDVWKTYNERHKLNAYEGL